MRDLAQAPTPHLDEAQVDRPSSARWLREPRTQRRDPRAGLGATTASTDGHVDADRLRPHAAPARAAPARRASGTTAAPAPLRRRPAPAARPRRGGRRSCWRATSPRSGPRAARDVAGVGGRRPARLRRAWERLETVAYRDEQGTRAARPPRRSRCRPPRRRCPSRLPRATGTSRCSPTPTASASSRPRSQPLKLTLSGDPTVTVDGRVAASWAAASASGDAVRLTVTPHVEIRRAARARDPRGGEAHRPLLRAGRTHRGGGGRLGACRRSARRVGRECA